MPESAQPRGWGSARTDAVVAIALFAVAEVEVALAGLGASAVLAAGVATLPLAFRRRAPVLTVLFVVLALALGGDWAEKTNTGFLVLLLASYSVGAYASRTRALVGAAVLVAVMAGAVLFEGDAGDVPFVLSWSERHGWLGAWSGAIANGPSGWRSSPSTWRASGSSALSWRSPRSAGGWRPSYMTLLGTP